MPQHRSSRLRDQAAQQQELAEQDYKRINFWDIQYGEEAVAIQKAMQVFQPEEKAKLANVLGDFLEKKREYVLPFLERVPLEVAADYRSIIAGEMYFSLIKERIENGYYRSQEALLSDIDLVSYNAKIYNGEEHDIAQSAKELCERVRVKLKQSMFLRSETIFQQNLANAGKLTAPSRIRSALQTKQMYDELRNSGPDPKDKQPQTLGTREEAKADQVMKEVAPASTPDTKQHVDFSAAPNVR